MHHKLPRGLYALIDDAASAPRPVVETVRLVLEGGAAVLQLRLKATPDREALAVARATVNLAGAFHATVIVDDRVDVALLAGAHGVHVGAEDLPVREVRTLVGPERLVGATTRSLADIHEAARQGADHVGLGPVFPTTTKVVAAPALSVEGVARIVRDSPLPVVAIGGITLATIAGVAAAGVWCAAVGSELLRAPDVSARARALQSTFFGA